MSAASRRCSPTAGAPGSPATPAAAPRPAGPARSRARWKPTSVRCMRGRRMSCRGASPTCRDTWRATRCTVWDGPAPVSRISSWARRGRWRSLRRSNSTSSPFRPCARSPCADSTGSGRRWRRCPRSSRSARRRWNSSTPRSSSSRRRSPVSSEPSGSSERTAAAAHATSSWSNSPTTIRTGSPRRSRRSNRRWGASRPGSSARSRPSFRGGCGRCARRGSASRCRGPPRASRSPSSRTAPSPSSVCPSGTAG